MTTELLVPYKLAATRLNVSESTLRRLVRDGDIVAVKVRGRAMIPVDSLESFVESLIERETVGAVAG